MREREVSLRDVLRTYEYRIDGLTVLTRDDLSMNLRRDIITSSHVVKCSA